MNPSFDARRISRASVADLDALVPLFDGYRRFYEQTSDPEGARAFLGERFAKGDSVVFVARFDGRIVGFTQLYPTFSSVSMRRLWILNDLFVAPEVRGNGIAGALLDRAREHARETGAKGLVLETAKGNKAKKLYEEKGWKRDEEFEHYSIGV